MNAKAALLAKIANRSAVIGIVGLGDVALPLISRFIEQGFASWASTSTRRAWRSRRNSCR